MAITSRDIEIQQVSDSGNDWVVSLYSTDITGCEEIKAAVAGSTHYLKKIVLRTATAMAIDIGSGKSGTAVETIHIGSVPLSAEAGIFAQAFGNKMGLRAVADKALTIDSSAAGAVWVYAEGRTCKNPEKK